MLDTETDTSLEHLDHYQATLRFYFGESGDGLSEAAQVASAGVALNNAFPDVSILDATTGKTLEPPHDDEHSPPQDADEAAVYLNVSLEFLTRHDAAVARINHPAAWVQSVEEVPHEEAAADEPVLGSN